MLPLTRRLPSCLLRDCAKAGQTSSNDGEAPRFTLTVGGASVDVGEDDVLNGDDDIFPIRLDYQGPDAPHFFVDPNKREDGWVNASVGLCGRVHGSEGSKKDGWLVYNNDNADDGVGGYTPQLRFAEWRMTDKEVGVALAATCLSDSGCVTAGP